MLRLLLLRPITTTTTTTSFKRLFKRSFSQKQQQQQQHITVLFETPEGDTITCLAKKGDSILDVAHENDVELEGACESSLACSTCHVILEEGTFNQLPEPSDEENDLLDLAFGLTETSRLGCQVKLDESLEGIKVKLPAATRNMAVDGYKPKPH